MASNREIGFANSVIDVLSKAERSTRPMRATFYGSVAVYNSLYAISNMIPEGVNYTQAAFSASLAFVTAKASLRLLPIPETSDNF